MRTLKKQESGLGLAGKSPLLEIMVLRAIACLCIALLHSINRVVENPNEALNGLRLVLSFGTPAFVLISELVLAHAYGGQGVPAGFWMKRVKFVLIPYLVFGLLSAGMSAIDGGGDDKLAALLNYSVKYVLLGDFSGYFVLIIFQFYLLHAYAAPWLTRRFAMRQMLIGSFLLSAGYWGLIQYAPRLPVPFEDYLYDRFYMLPFIGWLFYFVLAYYFGRNYLECLALLERYRRWLWAAFILASALLLLNYWLGIIESVSSKRWDMVLFCTVSSLLILHLSAKARRIPNFWIKISQISFGIFLIHPLVYRVLHRVFVQVPGLDGSAFGVAALFLAGLAISIAAVRFVQQIRGGSYLVGRMGVGQSILKNN